MSFLSREEDHLSLGQVIVPCDTVVVFGKQDGRLVFESTWTSSQYRVRTLRNMSVKRSVIGACIRKFLRLTEKTDKKGELERRNTSRRRV